MEQHPVPQNITSFEFRLIGDMTVKQFALLTAGVIFGFIFWQLPLPTLIGKPIALLLFFLGAAFAFLPIEDRPLHRWLLAFIKSIYSPTQFFFQKSEKAPLYLTADFPQLTRQEAPSFNFEESRRKLEAYLKTLPKSLPTTLDNQEEEAMGKIQAILKTTSFPSRRTATPLSFLSRLRTSPPKLKLRRATPLPLEEEKPQPLPHKRLAFTEGGKLIFEEEQKTTPIIPFTPGKVATQGEILVDQIKRLRQEILTLKEKRPAPKAAPKEVVDYEKQLVALEAQLEQAEREKDNLMQAVLRLQRAASPKPKGVAPSEVLAEPQAVKIVSSQAAKKVGLPKLTEVPNVITGVVQDRRGTFLPNILVEVRDAEGDSVRAFKTNKLGQFAAATPLQNGTYTLALEDPRGEFIFDIIEIKVDGSVLSPLVIYAKGQTELEREKIRQSLFGGS